MTKCPKGYIIRRNGHRLELILYWHDEAFFYCAGCGAILTLEPETPMKRKLEKLLDEHIKLFPEGHRKVV